MSIKRLGELIRKFEDVYLETGAGAKLNLRNLETGDASNVELHFRPTGSNDVTRPGLWITEGDKRPVLLVDAAPAIQALAAEHLPELAELLDKIALIIESKVDAGTAALESWLLGRKVDV